jgi:hypothetical protein
LTCFWGYKFTAGTGIAAIGDSDQDDPVLGVATEPHDGATTGRQTGTEIKVSFKRYSRRVHYVWAVSA